MKSRISSCTSRAANVAGSLISLALVFGGSAAVAEGLTGFTATGDVASGLIGGISDADLEQLEHATVAEATAVRLAALGDVGQVMTPVRNRSASAPVGVGATDEEELFPHSGRLLPLLVARPQAAAVITQTALTPRPGLGQPVGVSRASLRSPTPSERSGR